MADSRKIVKVFLASPGDLAEERRAAKSAVDEYNSLTAEEFGYHVELIGWEDTVSVFGRPQATINRELERCELFIGMIWKKWGTPPDVAGPYTSGFEEEFETSVQRRLREGWPEISLLFKEIDPEFLIDPGDDLKKVLAFRERIIAEKKLYFETFVDSQECEKKIWRCIWKYVTQLRNRDIKEVSLKDQAPTSTGGEKQPTTQPAGSPPETPLSTEGAKFLREFISKTERSAEEEPITAVEIARFRLLANLLGEQGNDDRSLGVHDANLLFTEGRKFTFGYPELSELITTGLRNYTYENTPLWHWLAATNGFERQLLPVYSLMWSKEELHTGALAAMRLIAEPPPSDYRYLFLDKWFAKDAPAPLKVAALGYLGECGITADLATIHKEFTEGDNQTQRAAADAIIRIDLRDSCEKGINALYDLQPTSISPSVLEALFENEHALSTETLMGGVDHRSSDVRSIVVKLLRRRRALTIEMSEKLMSDSDASVRYEALMSLVDAGRIFSDAEAERILVGKGKSGTTGLIALALSDRTAEQYLEQFLEQRLRSLQDKELEKAAADCTIFNHTAEFILAERHFNLHREKLRHRVDDQYKAMFSRELDTMVEQYERYGSEGAELIEKTRSLENFMRKKLTRRGLDIICRQAEIGDLGRVRAAIKSGFVDYSAADIEYLQKFGEWEDIPLIIAALERPEAGRIMGSLLSRSDDSKFRTAARAIYALGRTRLSEVLIMPVPAQLLVHLIVESSDKVFRSLSDASIMLLLQSEADQVRKAVALKCIRALPKKRIVKLLDAYVSGDQTRYYNVVHWLDFGVSTPRTRALPAAGNLLNKEWRS